VTLPDGTISAAKFRTFQWPIDEAPGGVRIFACQHKTRETVWIPQLQQHANAAKCLKHTLVVSPEPAKDAAHMARLIDRDLHTEPDGAMIVASGSDRADFVFLTRDQLGRRYAGVPLTELPERGCVGLVLATGDIAACANVIGNAGKRIGSGVIVNPAKANGVLLVFVAA
jgi:hypothetical protein